MSSPAAYQEDQNMEDDGDGSKGQSPSDAAAAAAAVAEGLSEHVDQDPLPSDLDTLVNTEKRNRRRNDFPWKLHTMLEDVEKYHQTHVVSWAQDGTAFRVFKPDDFVAKIMPHYFHQTQFRSFQRMLNLYEFTKVLTGNNRGCYRHPKFIRNNRELCLEMRIRKRPKPKVNPGAKERIPASKKRSAAGKKGTERSTTSARPPPQQQQLEQQFMTTGGLLPRGNQERVLTMMMQQRQHQRHSLDLLQTSTFHPVVDSDIQSIMAQQSNEAAPFANTAGTLGSAPAPSSNADPASLHHHQALSPLIQRASLGLQQSAGLSFLPASWNTTVYPTHYGHTPPMNNAQEERIHPTSLGRDITGDYSARLKAMEDPSIIAPPLSAGQHPLFSQSSTPTASASHRQSHFLQTTADLLFQQPQQQPQQQQQQRDHDDMSFQSPLQFDLEPNPFP